MDLDYGQIFWDAFVDFLPILGSTMAVWFSSPWGWIIAAIALVGFLVPARRRR